MEQHKEKYNVGKQSMLNNSFTVIIYAKRKEAVEFMFAILNVANIKTMLVLRLINVN